MIPYCLRATFFISFVCSVPSAALTHSVGSLPAISGFLRLPRRQHPGADHKARTGSCQPSLLCPPHSPNASPVKRSHCGGVSKQIRQTIAVPGINPLQYFYGMPATAMPFGLLSQVCHTACSSFAFVRAATVSFTPLCSLLPSFRFITPRS